MISINFKSNIKTFTKGLTRIQKKQVPFATARALTWTAQDCQKALQDRAATVFNNVKKWWLKQQPTGIKIIAATKARLISSVYTKAHFTELQEEGGTKTPSRSKNLLIPSDKVPKSRRKAGGAGIMLKTKNVFSTAKGVYRRKGGAKRKNQKRELLFHKDKRATVRPRFGFRRTAAGIAARKFKRNFFRSLEKALKSAR